MSGLTDPIADMLTRIRNAGAMGHPNVLVPASQMKVSIAKVLKEEGFIRDYELLRGQPFRNIKIQLMYDSPEVPRIHGIKRISRPGLRKYVGNKEASGPRGGAQEGTLVLSTPQGVIAGSEARRRGIGGEVLCSIW